jgi:hypothetical protein
VKHPKTSLDKAHGNTDVYQKAWEQSLDIGFMSVSTDTSAI